MPSAPLPEPNYSGPDSEADVFSSALKCLRLATDPDMRVERKNRKNE